MRFVQRGPNKKNEESRTIKNGPDSNETPNDSERPFTLKHDEGLHKNS